MNVRQSTEAGSRVLRDRSSSPLLGLLWAVILFLGIVPAAQASHFRGASVSYTLAANGLVTVTSYSGYRTNSGAAEGFVNNGGFHIYTGTGGTGTLVGTMTLASTVNPYSTGVEFGGAAFFVMQEKFTLSLAGQPAGTYYAYTTSNAWLAGVINRSPDQGSWGEEVVIKYTPGVASAGPTMLPATVDIIGRGYPYNQNLNSTDPDGTPVTYQFLTGNGNAGPDYSPATLIPGMSLSSVGGVAIPAVSTAALTVGRYSYKVKVTDASGATAVRDVLVVAQDATGANANSPPVLASIGPRTISVGSNLSFNVSATDPDAGQALTVRAQLLPTGATFPQQTGASTGTSSTFSWTPVAGQEGTYQVNFEVDDNAVTTLTASELVTITVTGANHPPTLNSIGNKTVANGGTLSFTASATDPDAGQVVTYQLFNAPTGATINSTTGAFSWSPTVAQNNGTYTGITVRATDNGTPNLFAEETITITVGAGNNPPVVTANLTPTASVGQAFSLPVTANDPDAGQSLTLFASSTLPPTAAFPTVSGSATGISSTFTWTPTLSDVGLRTVNFRVQDNGSPTLTTEITVTISVVQNTFPTVSTPVSSAITGSTATLGGTLSATGGSTITARGVVYSRTSVNASPQIGGTGVFNSVDAATTTGAFTESVTGLTSGVSYSFSAYATNSSGTAYTTPVSSFNTLTIDATLAGLVLGNGEFAPAFDPSTTSYAGAVGGGGTSVTITPTATDSHAVIQVNINGGSYATVASGSTSGALALVSGAGTVNVKVTAQDGVTTLTYTITITPGFVSSSSVLFGSGQGGGTHAVPGTVAGGAGVGSWSSLRSGMAIASSGAIAFRGWINDVPQVIDATNDRGLWKSPNGSSASAYLLARTGSTAPQSGGALFDMLPLNPAVNNLGQTGFIGYLRVGSGSPAVTNSTAGGIWSELGGGGLQLLVRQGDTFSGSAITQVAPTGWLASSDDVAGTGYAAFTVKTAAGSAVVRATSTASTVSLAPVALEGTAAPAVGGTTWFTFDAFAGNSTDPRMDKAGDVAFLGSLAGGTASGIWYQSLGGSLVAVVRTDDPAIGLGGELFKAFERPTLSHPGPSVSSIAFRAFLPSTGQTIWQGNPADALNLKIIARQGQTTLPGTPGGSQLWNLWSPFSNANGKIAFRVSLLNGTETRAIVTDTDGTLKIIAKVGDAAPGLTGDTFVNFDHPIIGDGNQAAFVAATAGGQLGLWKQAAGGGALTPVIKIGDAVTSDGSTKVVAAFVVVGTASTDRLSEVTAMSAAGQVLVWVTYDTGDTGMLLTPP